MCGYDLHVVCFARKLKCFKFCFISMYQNGRKQIKKIMSLSLFWFKDFLRQATAMFVTLQSKSVGDQQVNY